MRISLHCNCFPYLIQLPSVLTNHVTRLTYVTMRCGVLCLVRASCSMSSVQGKLDFSKRYIPQVWIVCLAFCPSALHYTAHTLGGGLLLIRILYPLYNRSQHPLVHWQWWNVSLFLCSCGLVCQVSDMLAVFDYCYGCIVTRWTCCHLQVRCSLHGQQSWVCLCQVIEAVHRWLYKMHCWRS